jgi:voltage-gated potassium channel
MDTMNKYAYRLLVAAAIGLLAVGTVFYHFVEKWTLLDSLYFCVVTLSTVGYGDFAPTTSFGRLFTIFYILVGVGIIATFASAFMKKQASRVKTHREDKHKQ